MKKIFRVVKNFEIVKRSCSLNRYYRVGTIQVLRHQRGGWGQNMANLDDLQYWKSSKRCQVDGWA